MHIGGTVTELVSEAPAAGYTVIVAGYAHSRIFVEPPGSRPHWITQTATTGAITLQTNAAGAFGVDPATPTVPEGDEPTTYSASVTVQSASGVVLAHQEPSSPGTSFNFALTVPFESQPGHLAIGGHVTEKWSGHKAVGYALRIVPLTKQLFLIPATELGGHPRTVTLTNSGAPITATTDANGHFFTQPPTPPLPEPPSDEFAPGPVTHGASVTVSANGIDLVTATREVATNVLDFTVEISGWTSAGPRNFTCVIVALAVHPSNPRIVYAGAQYGGVWKTTDGGGTWTPTMDSQSNLYVGAVGLCVARPDVIYAVTQSSAEFAAHAGLLRSTDGGVSWQKRTDVPSVSSAGTDNHVQIAVHPTNPDIVYVAGDSSLHRSNDGGNTWIVHNITVDGAPQTNTKGIFDGNIGDVKLDPDHPDTVYIAVPARGIYSCSDGGTAWSKRGGGVQFSVKDSSGTHTVGFGGGYRCVLGLGGTPGERRLAAKVQGTILISDDAGNTWHPLSGTDHGYEPDSPNWDSCVAVMPGSRDVIVAGGDGLQATFDAGAHWLRLHDPMKISKPSPLRRRKPRSTSPTTGSSATPASP
jgi:photosystem II stability/assembly factor-like uncharacterized protein